MARGYHDKSINKNRSIGKVAQSCQVAQVGRAKSMLGYFMTSFL